MITKHLILLDIIKISILLYSGLGLSADLDLFSVNWLLSTSLELYSQALLVMLCEKVASDLWVGSIFSGYSSFRQRLQLVTI